MEDKKPWEIAAERVSEKKPWEVAAEKKVSSPPVETTVSEPTMTISSPSQVAEEQFQQGVNPEAGKYFEEQRDNSVNNDKIIEAQTKKRAAAKDLLFVQDNTKYTPLKELEQLHNELTTQTGPVGAEGKGTKAIEDRINQLRNQPVNQVDLENVGVQGEKSGGSTVMLKKSPFKTYGEMFDATQQAKSRYTENLNSANAIDTEMKPYIEKRRKQSGLVLDGKDDQGNEYYKMNPMESFLHGAGESLNAIDLTFASKFKDPNLINRLNEKYVMDNYIEPKKAEGALAQGAEVVGGLTPLIAAGVIAPEGIGALAVNALTFGATDYGAGLYGAYSEAKAAGDSDEQALAKAKDIANARGAGGLALGGTMPLQGALGRKLFINEAEKSAFKTFLSEQAIMVPSFMGNQTVQNWYAGKPLDEGVAEAGLNAFIIGGSFHALANFPKLQAKTKEAFENVVAKNFGDLQPVIDGAVKSGALDYAAAETITKKAGAYNSMPKDLKPELESEILPTVMEIQDLEREKERAGDTYPTNTIEATIEAKKLEIAEKTGAPLTEKETKEYEKLVEKRDAPAGEDGKKVALLDSEKAKIKHFEKRIEQSEKNETEAKELAESEEQQKAEQEQNIEQPNPEQNETTETSKETERELLKQEPAVEITPEEPITRKELFAKEPVNLREAIMQWFAGGGKVTPEDFARYTGFKGKDSNPYFWAKKSKGKGGIPVDKIAMENFGDWIGKHDEQEIINEIFDVLSSYTKRSEIENDLMKMKQEQDFLHEHGMDKREYDRLMEEYKKAPAEEEIESLSNEYDGLTEEQQAEIDHYINQGRKGETDEVVQGDATKERHEEGLTEAKQRLSEARSEYEAATKALNEDLSNKQMGMFEGKEQKIFDDTAEMQQRAETAKTKMEEAQKDVDKFQDLIDQNLPGQQRIDLPAQTEKFYENIAGAQPNNQTGRIPVDPIIGGSPKAIKDIIFDVTKGVKQRLFFAKPGSRRAAGTYNPGNTAIKIKYTGDLDVTAHEIGHSIDDHFGILSDLQNTPNLPAEVELMKFAPFGSTPPKGHPNPRMYKYGEGFAEWLRAYIVNPKQAEQQGPNIFAMYDGKVHAEYKKAIEQFSTDVRTFAGSSGRDMTMSNVEWKPEEKKGIVGQMLSKSEANNMFSIGWWDKTAANFVNPLRAFEKANQYAKGIKGIDKQLPENDPELLARLLLGVDSKTSEILESGMIDGEMNVLKDKDGNPKNLKWLLEPLDNTDQSTIEKDAQDVAAFMIAQRTIELAGRFERSSGLTGIGGGIFQDVDVAQKTIQELSSQPEKLARITEAASRYREMADDILKYMVDKGRLSKENYDKIKKDNNQYVSLQRIMEVEPGREAEMFKGESGKLGSKKEVIQRIKGSSNQIKNPYTSLLDGLYKGVKESDRNEVLKTFRDMLVGDRGMYQGQPDRFADIGVQVKQGDKETIPIYVDGNLEYWKFQTDVYKALKGLDSEAYRIPGVFTAHARALRWTVTHFPVFAAKNVVRDFQDRIIKSNENSWRNAFGIKDFVGDKEHWKEVARAGGLNGGYYMKDRAHYDGLLVEAMHDIAKNKKFILADPVKLKEGWEGYKSILSNSETVNRVAEYRAAMRNAKERGLDDYNSKLYGALKSRDLLDFAVMGNWMKYVNQVIPFSNAAVQGLRSGAVRAKENPAGFAARMAMFSMIPSVAEWLLAHIDDETAKEYEELPAYQRDMFYNYKIGDNKWLSIPKPYELSLTGSGINRSMSAAAGVKGAFDGYAGSVFQSLSPIDEASFVPGFQPEVEGIVNYDFFRGKSIVPPHENSLTLALRNAERASRFGQSVQDVAGIDARKIDHWVRGSASYYGNMGLKLSDLGRKDKKNQFDIPDLGFFKATPAYNSKSVQEFMKFSSEYGLTGTKEYKEFSRLAKSYFDADGDSEKENKSKILIDYVQGELSEMQKKAGNKLDKKSGKENKKKARMI